MKHIVKIMSLVVSIAAFWIGLLEASVVPRNYGWLLPIYLSLSLGCYGLLMVGVGLMRFPTCPQEAGLLQKVFYIFPSLSIWLFSFTALKLCGLTYEESRQYRVCVLENEYNQAECQTGNGNFTYLPEKMTIFPS
ncbi:dolichol-phosphate mannose synthase subunit 3-like [Telopea speciosissima]|uniref:dolichol-phosphate mannose synthase subunit 3-like n=1 Tax=Telopea speciosissima TaxID=54955 RepID=UPI001CC413F8|nr:dolichol-phosphate mannose synthase subunit 3-like [Telopea speciosissima]